MQWLWSKSVWRSSDLFITSFRPYIISYLFNLAQFEWKCLYVRGNEIELKVLCQLEKFQVIGQGQSRILWNNISGALWNVHHFNVVWFIVILHRKYSQKYKNILYSTISYNMIKISYHRNHDNIYHKYQQAHLSIKHVWVI